MNDFVSNLGLGIISGIISALIVAFFILIYKKIIEPYLRKLFYKDVKVNGNWYCEYYIEINNKKIKKFEFHLQIKQTGYNINGYLNVKNFDIDTENTLWSYYTFRGKIINNFISINYETKDSNKIGLGQLLLEILGGGNILKGDLIFTELNTMKIGHISPLHFDRVDRM